MKNSMLYPMTQRWVFPFAFNFKKISNKDSKESIINREHYTKRKVTFISKNLELRRRWGDFCFIQGIAGNDRRSMLT